MKALLVVMMVLAGLAALAVIEITGADERAGDVCVVVKIIEGNTGGHQVKPPCVSTPFPTTTYRATPTVDQPPAYVGLDIILTYP